MSERDPNDDRARFIVWWIIAIAAVIGLMYLVIVLSGPHIRETYSPPVEGTRR